LLISIGLLLPSKVSRIIKFEFLVCGLRTPFTVKVIFPTLKAAP